MMFLFGSQFYGFKLLKKVLVLSFFSFFLTQLQPRLFIIFFFSELILPCVCKVTLSETETKTEMRQLNFNFYKFSFTFSVHFLLVLELESKMSSIQF